MKRASFAVCDEARDSQSVPTKDVLQLLQQEIKAVSHTQHCGGRAVCPASAFVWNEVIVMDTI